METKERESLLQALLDGRLPDKNGRFGPFGGRYVPETLMPAIERLTHGVEHILPSADFQAALGRELKSWIGRPTALTPVPTLSQRWGADVWLKREDLAHTGAHKINNGIGQALLAKALGAKRVVAETGAGQHGVASAAACARVGLPCTVYMGEIDVARQAPNVDRMRRFGATVVPVKSGDRTLRAAIDEAIRDWVSDPVGTYYLLGSAIGPHPYPYLVRQLQAVIGREARAQMLSEAGGLPDAVFACVGGGSQRDRPISRLSRRSQRQDLRRRGRRPRRGARRPLRDAVLRQTRRAARHAHDAALRQARPDPGDALDLGRSRLPRRRSRACVAASDRPRRIRHGQRRRDARVARRAVRHRGHPARARELARAGGREALGRDSTEVHAC